MFNSLNSLSYLISTDRRKAAIFTENLAEIYRYILSQKDRALVLLDDELAFTRQYADLLHLRFGNALQLRTHLNGNTNKQFLIPPTSVFVALENAVKHNEISEPHPLLIDIHIKDKELVISNPLRRKRNLEHSSGIGLKNLDERFRLSTGKGIDTVVSEDSKFQVTMPLVPMGDSPEEEQILQGTKQASVD